MGEDFLNQLKETCPGAKITAEALEEGIKVKLCKATTMEMLHNVIFGRNLYPSSKDSPAIYYTGDQLILNIFCRLL